MGTGYTRQSSGEIITGEVMEASDFNNEFNQIESAFNASTGHTHDGTSGEGPVLTLGTGVTGTLAQLNTAVTDATIVSLAGTETLTNKTLTSPTITTPTLTLADANGAAPTTDGEIKYDRTGENLEVGDGTGTKSFSHDTGTATLQNKTINLSSNTLTGTTAQFNTALSDGSFATLAGTETLTNKTINGDNNTLSNLDIGNEVDWAAAADVTDRSAFASGDKMIIFEAGVGLRKIDYDDLPGASGAVQSSDFTADGDFLVGTGSGTYQAENGATARTSLGLGSLATLNTVNNSNWSGTDLAVANGGTGSSTASGARTALGLVIGTDVQAYDAELAAIAGLTSAADRLPYFTGSGTASLATFTSFGRSLVDDASATAARTTLGLGSIATQASSNVSISGGSITGITDLAVADGGTGASTAANARTNLGLVLDTDVVAVDGPLVAIGNLDPVAGDILYFTGTNTPARLAKGTADQVLTMNSGATAPEWADASGGWTQVAQTSATDTVTVSGLSGYDHIRIAIAGSSTSGDPGIRLTLGDSGGLETSGYQDMSFNYEDAAAGDLSNVTTSYWTLLNTIDNAEWASLVTLSHVGSNIWVVSGMSCGLESAASDERIQFVSGQKTLSAAITQLQIELNSGTGNFNYGVWGM